MRTAMGEQRPDFRTPFRIRPGLMKFRDRLLIISLLFIDLSQEVMSNIEVRLQLEGLLIIGDCPVILARPISNPTNVSIDYKRKRVKLLGILDLRDSFAMTSHR